MKYFNYIFFVLATLLLMNSCKTLSTDASIKQIQLPQIFQSDSDSSSIANINWKNYFADSTLVSLIDSALSNNIDLQIALQRIEMARAQVKFFNGNLFPKAEITTSAAQRKFGLYTMDGAGNISTEILPGEIVPIHLPDYYVGAQATWEIDVWGKLRNQKKSAKARFLASIEGVNFIKTLLISDVASAYYELIALDNELEVLQSTIQYQEEALEVVKLQKDAGRTNELAVQQFQAQLLNTQALELQTKQRIVETENYINFLLGRYPQPIARNKSVLFKPLPNTLNSGVPSQLLVNRPDIREAELMVKATKFDVKSAKYAFLPSFNIIGGMGFQAFNTELLFLSPTSIAYTALGGLVAPLINISALKAQFKTAKANQIDALYNYQKTILRGYVEVVNELSNIYNLSKITAIKQEQADVLLLSVQTSKELYKSAKAGYLEVLITQQGLMQARLDLIYTTKLQRISTVNIYRSLGGGWK
jgi:outer membrane protein, multidrug efflux system